MKLAKRILSTLLAVTMLCGVLASLASFGVSAAANDSTATVYPIGDYTKKGYNTPEEKLASMKLMNQNDAYQLYVDEQSGEIALYEIASKNILFSNPYDVAYSKGSDSTKAQLLSQLTIIYTDTTSTTPQYLYSYTDAALNGQISVQKIKSGVRVEYTIGREDSRKLVPKRILGDSFEQNILVNLRNAVENGEISEDDYRVFLNAWQEIDLNGERKIIQLTYLERYPFLEDYATTDAKGKTVYPVLYDFREDSINASQLLQLEEYIKSYCPDYTFEQMDMDHETTEYEAEEAKYPLFKLALEYYLDEEGMLVRLPCNGLRYDASTYKLEDITILPYMGAGNNKNAGYEYNNGEAIEKTIGYTFFPDGSGSLFDYEELNTSTVVQIPGKIYGEDFAYYDLSGMKYQKLIRYPVYGAVSSEVIHKYTYMDKKGETYPISVSNTVKTAEQVKADIEALKESGCTILSESIGKDAEVYSRGYMAVVETADSFGELQLLHGGSLHSYNTILNFFNPKPKDSYNLSDAISVAGNTMMTVESDRKYTGSIEIHYTMLCDENRAAEAKTQAPEYTHYETSWFGMAEAYRDYLCNSGVLKALTNDDIKADIPLYIEVFGALETQQTIATIPVNMMTPLTTFENLLTMYEDLSSEGIRNINFKMTGFANGGMYYTVPSSLNWEGVVGGKDGFKDLVNKANTINQDAAKHIGLYPDFDFAYIHENTLFDAVVLQDDAVKTIDNRYTSYRQYSATQQAFVSFYQLAISPFRYSKFYNELLKNYEQYGLKSMSVGSLGNTLNSDFNEDNPINREDSKDYTKEALATMKNQGYSLMTDGGNAYTWAYVDHILDVDLDSSRYIRSCASVPFIGVVLHGYKQFASTPLNEEGDINYAILRAIENGAGMYFILSYQNTSELKDDSFLSQYYSIRYDIWKSDVIKYYNTLNGLLKDVQTKVIVDHDFLVGERVLDDDELQADIAEKLEELEKLEDEIKKEQETAELIAISEAWALAYGASEKIESLKAKLDEINKGVAVSGDFATVTDLSAAMQKLLEAIKEWAPLDEQMKALEAQLNALEDAGASEDEIKAVQAEITALRKTYNNANKKYENAQTSLTNKINDLRDYTESLVNYAAEADKLYAEALSFSASLAEAQELITNTSIYDGDEETRELLLNQVVAGKNIVDAALPAIKALHDVYDLYLNEESDSYIGTVAVNAQAAIFEKGFEDGGAYAAYKDYQNMVLDDFSAIRFDAKDIEDMVEVEEDLGSDVEDDENLIDNAYIVDNNKIVLVTYGDRNATTYEKTAYKAFILNYNNFAVRVTHNGITYTVASGGYVVIDNPTNN